MRRLRILRHPIALAAMAAVIAALAAILLLTGGGTGGSSTANSSATAGAVAVATAQPSPSPDQLAVQDVVDRFVAALATGDGDTLYALQEESFRQRCSRTDFEAIVQALKGQQLSGPARVVVQGDLANARLFAGNDQPVILPLRREADGSWRVVAQTSRSCS